MQGCVLPSLGSARSADNEGVVVEALYHQADRDLSEGVADEWLDVRFWNGKRHNGNPVLAYVVVIDALQCVRMLRAVDGVDSRFGDAVASEVYGQDGVAVPINLGKFIEAGLVQDGHGVIGCNGAQIIIEIGARWAEHLTHRFHRGIMPRPGKQKVTVGVARRRGHASSVTRWHIPAEGKRPVMRCLRRGMVKAPGISHAGASLSVVLPRPCQRPGELATP